MKNKKTQCSQGKKLVTFIFCQLGQAKSKVVIIVMVYLRKCCQEHKKLKASQKTKIQRL